MKYLLILTLSILTISSCKSKKQTQETVEKVEAIIVEKQNEIVENEKYTLEDLTPEEVREYSLIQADFSDSLVAQIRRTPCFGHCPTYILNVYKKGYVEYNGDRNVDYIGLYSSNVSKETIDKLINKADEIGFFDMKYFYDNQNVTDIPTTITSIRNNSEIKTIVSRFESPNELRAFNKYFDQLFSDIKWVKLDEEK